MYDVIIGGNVCKGPSTEPSHVNWCGKQKAVRDFHMHNLDDIYGGIAAPR